MMNVNYEFLEAYKRVDKLCREIFSDDRGVSAYIEAMKTVSPDEVHLLDEWEHDLKNLVRLRHLRNQLTHECGTLELELASQTDIQWLWDFYGRILKQLDPLSLLRIKKEKTNHPQKLLLKSQDEDDRKIQEKLSDSKRNDSVAVFSFPHRKKTTRKRKFSNTVLWFFVVLFIVSFINLLKCLENILP